MAALISQAVPRVIWLDKSGKQLVQWPISEIELLREARVGPRSTLLQGGSTLEIRGITAAQVSSETAPPQTPKIIMLY